MSDDDAVAVLFALPAESSDFVRLLEKPVTQRQQEAKNVRGRMHGRPVAVFHTGVGEKSCKKQLTSFFQDEKIKFLISAGFAGALDPKLQVGNLLLAENFSSVELLTSPRLNFGDATVHIGKLATVPRVIDSRVERNRWAAESGAAAVDMETAFIAEACAAHRIPMLSLRVITDTPSDPFPVPPEILFDIEIQKTDLIRLSRYLLLNPGAFISLNSFRRRVAFARRALTSVLEHVLRDQLL